MADPREELIRRKAKAMMRRRFLGHRHVTHLISHHRLLLTEEPNRSERGTEERDQRHHDQQCEALGQVELHSS